jgi:hypothetical protein
MPSVEPLWLEVSAGAASSMVYILARVSEYTSSISWFIVISHPPLFEIPLWEIVGEINRLSV